VQHDSPPPLDDLDRQLAAIGRRTRRIMLVFTAAFAVIAIVFISGTSILLAGESGLHDEASCEVTYNHQYAQVQQIRTQLTNESNDAVETLIEAVFTVVPGETKAQQASRIEQAYSRFRATEASVARERATHPVPKVPSC
jgi:siderophore synthetase component